MGPVAIIAGIGLAVGAVGTYESVKAQQKQAKYAKQAVQAQRSQDNLKAARERREAIRNARIASGSVLQSSVTQGVDTGSAALGGLGSIDQQLNQGLSFLDSYNRLSDQASHDLDKANEYGVKSGTWGAAANLGMTVFKNASGINKAFGG